ncbi:MAG: hypothetical protein JWM36_696 [Hyphomicrobiales bacterium]|nr:hypothetical protein [Hyphomicrobiales bacterium]
MTDSAKVCCASTPSYELDFVLIWEGFRLSGTQPGLQRLVSRLFVIDGDMKNGSCVPISQHSNLKQACREATKYTVGCCQLRVCLQRTGDAP